MSENKDREIDFTYSLFATDDGEVATGVGTRPRDEFADFMGELVAEELKHLTDMNPARWFSLVVETSDPPEHRGGWVYHTKKYHILAPVMIPLGRLFHRVASWLWSKLESGEWRKTTRPVR